jgi:hypothetical protein
MALLLEEKAAQLPCFRGPARRYRKYLGVGDPLYAEADDITRQQDIE